MFGKWCIYSISCSFDSAKIRLQPIMFTSFIYYWRSLLIIRGLSLPQTIRNFSYFRQQPHLRTPRQSNHLVCLFPPLKNIAHLRPSLSFSAAQIMICAFITYRIDYCHIIIYDTSYKVLQKLQYIQQTHYYYYYYFVS